MRKIVFIAVMLLGGCAGEIDRNFDALREANQMIDSLPSTASPEQKAETYLKAALDVLKATHGKEHSQTLAARDSLALLYEKMGQAERISQIDF